MFDKFKQYMTRRQFGARTITSVALSSLFAGLLMASSVQWTPMSVAQGLDQKATRVVGTSAIPNSFTELAERRDLMGMATGFRAAGGFLSSRCWCCC